MRPAVESDLIAVGQVDSAARHHAYREVLPAGELAQVTPESQQGSWALRVAGEAGTHLMLVAELDGRVVGYSYVGAGTDPLIGDLYALFVHPDAHGTGVARQLLAESLAALRDFGYQTFLLWVFKGNDRAIRFYERAGWHHDGTVRVTASGAVSLRYLYP